jgi:hypothetical protein
MQEASKGLFADKKNCPEFSKISSKVTTLFGVVKK